MEPAVKLRREIVQELQENNKELQEDNKELQRDNKELQKDNKELQEEKKEWQKEKKDLQKRLQNVETGLAEFIRDSKDSGTSKEEILEKLQRFFSLSEKEATEKIKEYWDKA